ncbi:hypothetical protein HK104_000011 [Borealophlyctis nickersoniae]|nr:hypothetical protein HK104_000011 [Borealophlyctis nickersoniae]
MPLQNEKTEQTNEPEQTTAKEKSRKRKVGAPRPWTEEEKETVRNLVAIHGTSWVKVAADFNLAFGRTPNQISAWWSGQHSSGTKRAKKIASPE